MPLPQPQRIITDHKFTPGINTSCSPKADRSCTWKGCGKSEEAHGQAKQTLPAWIEADEFLTKLGLDKSSFHELARSVLVSYIEWKRGFKDSDLIYNEVINPSPHKKNNDS